MSNRIRASLAAIGVLLVSGVVCNLLAKDSAQLDAAVERVAHVPKVVGDWQAHDEELDTRAFEQTGAKGYWVRTYVNQRTKESVLVILMCGRPGKMAVHTPEVCYGGAGHELQNQAAPCAIKSGGSFWSAHFVKKGVESTHLRLYWAWNATGEWDASPGPRWQFRGEPFLYKLYVSRDNSQQPNLAAQADPTAEFLRQFVPVMKKTLFEAPGPQQHPDA